jgi:hypothetical protein
MTATAISVPENEWAGAQPAGYRLIELSAEC